MRGQPAHVRQVEASASASTSTARVEAIEVRLLPLPLLFPWTLPYMPAIRSLGVGHVMRPPHLLNNSTSFFLPRPSVLHSGLLLPLNPSSLPTHSFFPT